jgi:molybdate transport system substrate-binding protein
MTRLGCVLLLASLAAGAGPASAEPKPVLRVLAAASLTEVVEALAQPFEDARVEASFGSSGTLARQIRDGAPADVFLSASAGWIEYLAEADALADGSVVIARNRLVCIAGRSAAAALGPVAGPRVLLERLGSDARVAIADEGVPAGEYARRALERAGLLEAYRRRLVGQRDVRAVLNAVERGDLTAGFVYATDAAVADVAVLFSFEASSHPPIEYRAAVLRGAQSPARARSFLEYLQSEAARAALSRAGFALP